MRQILNRLVDRFGPDTVGDWLAKILPKMIIAAIVLAVFYGLWRLVDRASRLLARKAALDATAMTFIRTVARVGMMTLALVTALSELGINTGAFVASLGIVGLTIGFAARDTLSNVISGLFIFWDRPFVVGDLIEVDGKYGRVTDITLRSTRVVTPDGKMLAIPNTAMVNTTVASYTNFPNLRLDIDMTVGPGEDLGRVRAIFSELVGADPRFLTTPPAEMVVTAVNDYNLALQFRVWLADEKQHIAERFALRERLLEALRAARVEMPLETLQLAPVELRQTLLAGTPPT